MIRHTVSQLFSISIANRLSCYRIFSQVAIQPQSFHSNLCLSACIFTPPPSSPPGVAGAAPQRELLLPTTSSSPANKQTAGIRLASYATYMDLGPGCGPVRWGRAHRLNRGPSSSTSSSSSPPPPPPPLPHPHPHLHLLLLLLLLRPCAVGEGRESVGRLCFNKFLFFF